MRRLINLVLILVCCSFLSVGQVVNLKAPQGTYYLTDKSGKDYKIVLKPKQADRSTSYYDKGKAELTRLGDNSETFYGSWRRDTKYNASPAELYFVTIELSENSDMLLGDGRITEFVISRDGWAYPDWHKCMDENPKYRVKVSNNPKGAVSGNRNIKSKAAADIKSREISIDDFITGGNHVNFNMDRFLEMGFIYSEDVDNGYHIYKRNDLTVIYSEDFGDDGKGCRYINIDFPNDEDSWNFVKKLAANKAWHHRFSPGGHIFEIDGKSATVFAEGNSVTISESN